MTRARRRRRAIGGALIGLAAIAILVLIAAVVFGGPQRLPPAASVSSPFATVDFSDLPPLRRFTARDGLALAYRVYPPADRASASPLSTGPPRGSVVLVHGSSARSDSLHPLAKGFAAAGYRVYVLDIRGHGASGTHGRIGYIGQLEDDLSDFVATVAPPRPRSLVGFSAGGGFVLRFAADPRRAAFDDVLLLAPFIGQDSPTFRTGAGWASVGLPRIVALTVLNRLGIHRWNDLTVVSYAIEQDRRERLTGDYSYALSMNFRPHLDERDDMRAADRPMALVVGADDDEFVAARYAEAFASAGRPIPVTIVPGVGHVGLTTTPAGIQASVAALERLQK